MIIIGVMCGTSRDGIDLAAVNFFDNPNGHVGHSVLAAETIDLSPEFLDYLHIYEAANAPAAAHCHTQLGRIFGEAAHSFAKRHNIKADAVASHGITVHHNPAQGYTWQLGQGAAMAVAAGMPAICDFRTGDVALGGQGAPLVPVGDLLLYSDYAVCINLGGIANVGLYHGQPLAFDVCGCNLLLNEVYQQCGLPGHYDKGGALAMQGQVDAQLLQTLNALPYMQQPAPKSLDAQEVLNMYQPPIQAADLPTADTLATLCEHMALQLATSMRTLPPSQVLVTGGGAHHAHLINKLSHHAVKHSIVVPSAETINFKEAIIFALLGYLRWHGRNNVLAAVTGASRDSCGGCIYLP